MSSESLLFDFVLYFPILVLVFFVLAIYFSLPSRRAFSFAGGHAFITGGSKGIGKELARALVRRGCSVSLAARDRSKLEALYSELRELATSLGNVGGVAWYHLDVTHSYERTQAVIRRSEEILGPISILINNAGNSVQAAFEALPIEEFEKQMKINYHSAVFASRAVLPSMKRAGGGHIAFVSSAAAQCAIYGYTAYGASKFALRGFAEALHMELLPHNIGVSVLYPPNTDTEGYKEELRTMPEEVMAISGAAGLFDPRDVAEKALADIEAGNFSTSVGFEGWMLSVLSAGAAPETSFLRAIAQTMLAGVLRGVMLIYIGKFNGIVAAYKAKRG